MGLAIFVIYSLIQSQKRIEKKLKELQYACGSCNNSSSTISPKTSNDYIATTTTTSPIKETSNYNLLNNLKKAIINSM